ncbi:hypothetical protein BYT27DRAFT_7217995 [Phlegmacium glaucopus]|nr:hypothetical protein BYT27DRAFT_7217995 [Phlegmacium glaucopus]
MDSDNPALDANGMLKDASEIEFFNSPSDKQPLAHPTTTDQDSDSRNSGSNSETSEPIPRGLKGKQPATIVAGKRVRRATSKARMQKGNSGKFFEKNFIVDSPTPSGSSHFFKKHFIVGSPNASGSKHAKKSPPKSRKRAASSVNAISAAKRARTMAESESDGTDRSTNETTTQKRIASSADTTNAAKRRTTIEDESDAEDITALDDDEATEYTSNIDNEKDDDPVAEYEKMKETFQKVHKVYYHFFAPRKHRHRGNDPRTQDLRVMYTKCAQKVDGKTLEGHTCNVCVLTVLI